jgi:hypothetical protein
MFVDFVNEEVEEMHREVVRFIFRVEKLIDLNSTTDYTYYSSLT